MIGENTTFAEFLQKAIEEQRKKAERYQQKKMERPIKPINMFEYIRIQKEKH